MINCSPYIIGRRLLLIKNRLLRSTLDRNNEQIETRPSGRSAAGMRVV